MTSVLNDLVLTDDLLSQGRSPGYTAALARLVRTTTDICVLVDRRQCIRFINPAAEELLGLPRARVLGTPLAQWFEGLHAERSRPGDPVPVRLDDRAPVLQLLSCIALPGGGSQWLLLDPDLPVRAQQQLIRQRELLRLTCAAVMDAVIALRVDGSIEFVNPMACELLQVSERAPLPADIHTLLQFIDPLSRQALPQLLADCLQRGQRVRTREAVIVQGRGGVQHTVFAQIAPLLDSHRCVDGALLVFRPEALMPAPESRPPAQVHHDALTLLPSRQAFEMEVAAALEAALEGQVTYGLLLIDLYQFKLINDTCGHSGGDELLRQMAALLHSKLRSRDMLARLGSDEFGILLDSCTLAGAQRQADTLLRAVQGFRFCWEARELKVSISVGVVTIDRHSESVSRILSNANAACSLARESGRNKIHFYHLDPLSTSHRAQINWVVRIHEALASNRLKLYQQAVMPLQPGHEQAPHYEVLLRMELEDGALVGPGEFIPAAERYGLMDDIDCWVVEQIMRGLAQRHSAGLPCRSYAVNLSGATLGDSAFVGFVTGLFERYPFPPGLLNFEVTETAAVRHLDCAVSFMQQMRSRGCQFYLDDFGSGLSSFGYLKELPVDYLKIDGSFVSSMLDNESSFAMVSTFNHLAHVMGLQTVAEYVENDALQERLREMGIDFGQGFGLARPEPLTLP